MKVGKTVLSAPVVGLHPVKTARGSKSSRDRRHTTWFHRIKRLVLKNFVSQSGSISGTEESNSSV
jgi:hypothetical protein